MNIDVIKNENEIPVAGIVNSGIDFSDYIPPVWDDWFMGLVYDTARKSKDPSTKIGAVIVRENRPILLGYNGIPQKVKDLKERMTRPIKYKWTEHGERNALYCGARFGVATDGAIMYTQATPCYDCARGIINSGISKVIVHKHSDDLFAAAAHYGATWKEGDVITKTMFKEAGIELQILDRVLGKWSYVSGKMHKV